MRHLVITAILLIIFVALPATAAQWNAGAQVTQEVLDQYDALNHNGMPYRILLPAGYNPSESYPLLVSMHGGSGVGNDNESQILHWTANFVNGAWRKDFKCITICPQADVPWYQDNDRIDKAFAIMDKVREDYNIDENRIYIIGHSGGAFGTWEMLSREPDRFAAAITSAGGIDPEKCSIFKDVPIWNFHGDADTTIPVSYSRAIFDEMVRIGGNLKYSELPGKGHGSSWTSFARKGTNNDGPYPTQFASEQTDKTTSGQWDWLFSQSKTGRGGSEKNAALNKKLTSEFSEKIWASFDAGALKPTEIFKVRDGVALHYFAPATARVPGSNVAHLYIHGGSFKGGTPNGYYRWSRYLAEHGVSTFSLKYRLLDREKGGIPTICVEDAKSAMRWLRANAKKLGIDPERIAVSGNSAGGHLAAALATIEGYNHPSDDLSFKTTPNLLLLGSPALDTGKFFGVDMSPMHNLNENLPDTLAIMGDSDPVIPMTSMEVFGQGVIDAGSEFEWWIFPGLGHGLNAQNESYLTPKLMHIYYSYFNFLAKNDYVDEPLPAGDEVRTMIRQRKLGE